MKNKYSENVKCVINAIKQGKMFLLFDSETREGETDITIPAQALKPSDVKIMRKDGGGLICVAIDSDSCDQLGLPFMSDIVYKTQNSENELKDVIEKKGDLKYDSRSSFSIWVNHRETRTGITDNDRTTTINKLGDIVEKVISGENVNFGNQFRTPGHVATLRAAKKLLEERLGQTELSIALAMIANITPAMVVCEMLDDKTGKALSKTDAISYAKLNNMPFIEGTEIIEAYNIWLQNKN